jgi:hypothetical protein
MPISKEQRSANAASRKLLKSLKGKALKLYVASADEVAKEIRRLKIKQTAAGKGYELTIKSKEALRKSLLEQAAILREEVKGLAEKSVTQGVGLNAGRYGKYNKSFLLNLNSLDPAIVEDVYSKVNADLLEIQLLKTYGDNLTYSRRIWKSSKLFERDARNVVAEGLARNRSVEVIARDLEVYVRKDKITLAKRYANIDQSPIRPGETQTEWEARVKRFKTRISSNMEYNSLRLVRTMTQGAIQDSNIAAASYTPSVQAFKWNLSPAHIVYSICEDIVAGNPWTYENFPYSTPPHPNCLSYVTFIEMPQAQFIKDLKAWDNNPSAPGTQYLNDWKAQYYDPIAMGMPRENYFNLFLDRANASAASLKRAA